MGRHGSLYGACAISGRYAGRHALGSLDRDRESRALLVTVARCHGGQLQAFAGLACQSQADQPPTEPGHEVDGAGIHMVCRQDQVTFVLAVFLVHQDHHAPGAQVGNDVLRRARSPLVPMYS
jgi:hypothetical protein